MKSYSNQNTAEAEATTLDIFLKGATDEWQLICKASSKSQGWMKSTKAMICAGGVLVQTTSEFRSQSGEVTACCDALAFVPNATIEQDGTDLRIV